MTQRTPLLLKHLSAAARGDFETCRAYAEDWRDPTNPSYRLHPPVIYDTEHDTGPGDSVPYKLFRGGLRSGQLAALYEINFRDRRDGGTVIAITEALVQGTWKRHGRVPMAVLDYVQSAKPRIVEMSRAATVKWEHRFDIRMISLLMDNPDFLEVAYHMSKEFGQSFTVGTLKGRRYNVLATLPADVLRRRGLSDQQIRFVLGTADAHQTEKVPLVVRHTG